MQWRPVETNTLLATLYSLYCSNSVFFILWNEIKVIRPTYHFWTSLINYRRVVCISAPFTMQGIWFIYLCSLWLFRFALTLVESYRVHPTRLFGCFFVFLCFFRRCAAVIGEGDFMLRWLKQRQVIRLTARPCNEANYHPLPWRHIQILSCS